MVYFAWIIGLGCAVALAVVSTLKLDAQEEKDK